MEDTVALWTPHIQPPSDWLIPAILYQDRIATFGPNSSVDNRDVRELNRVSAVLGDFYESVSLPEAFAGQDDLIQVISGNMGRWRSHAKRLGGQAAKWAEQGGGFLAARDSALRTAADIESRLVGLDENIQRINDELNSLVQTRKENLRLAKEDRSVRLATVVERKRQVTRAVRHFQGSEAELESLITEVQALNEQIDNIPLAGDSMTDAPEISRMEHDLDSMKLSRKDLRRAASLLPAYARRHGGKDAPFDFSAERPHKWPNRDGTTWGLPPNMATIAMGKFNSDLVTYLATDGGMWVASPPDQLWVRTLVGPRFVVDEIMEIVARFYASEHTDCVLMSGEQHFSPAVGLPNSVEEAYVSVLWRLPVPKTRDIVAARDFRLNHQEELDALKKHLRQPLRPAMSADELKGAVREMEAECAEALSEIEKALALNPKLELRHLGYSVLSELKDLAPDVAVGTAATLASVPIFGVVGTAGSIAGELATGLVTGISVHVVGNGFDRIRRRRSKGRNQDAYQYVYKVEARFS